MIKNLLYFIIECLDSNNGYSTSVQKRFKVGEKVKISTHSGLIAHTPATIIETGRYDYLIEDDNGEKHIVFQFELY